MRRPDWRTASRTRGRRAELLLVRLAAILLIGWISEVVGLWQADSALLSPDSGQTTGSTDRVAFAAPARQDEEATPTPEDGGPGVQPSEVEGPTPTATVSVAPPSPPSPSPSPIPYTGDLCFGDEVVTFMPEDPRTSNELLIVVTSRYQYKYPRLAGTEKAAFVRERPGQLGYVWEWTIEATWPGEHHYIFYVDSTIPCKKIDVMVKRHYYTPTPTPTKTPKPTKTPDASNENNTNNDNNT